MSLSQSRLSKNNMSAPPQDAQSNVPSQADLTKLFKTFKNIRADETLPEPVRTQQLRTHAALIYEQLSNKPNRVNS